MIDALVARLLSGTIRALTGARALWEGSTPSADRRVYYGNHASHGDFVMIWSALPLELRGRVRPVAGADYWNKDPLRRYVINNVFRGVLIERDAAQRTQDPIATLCEAVDFGASLIVFPEGTRNTGDGLLPFKSGIYHLASQRPELEFVPVWLDNLKRVMPKGSPIPLPLLCTARFGSAIQLREGEDKAAFLARTRNALLALSDDGSDAVATAGGAA